MRKVLNIGVLGSGSFGTALATVSARCGNNTKVYSINDEITKEINTYHTNQKYFPKSIELPQNLTATNNLDEVLAKSDIIIHAIPMQSTYDFIKVNNHKIKNTTPYVIAIWSELVNGRDIPHCVLSGPSFAIEIMKNYPTSVTLACKNREVLKFVQKNLSLKTFRTYTTDDVIGVEIGGALKNPLAIASGIVEGYGGGPKINTTSSLVTRGILELSLFCEKFGGRKETLYGLSGMGDIVLTCLGNLSRNKAVGIEIANGSTLEEILKNNKDTVAEGIPTFLVLGEIIEQYNLNMPIMKNFYQVLKGEISIDEAENNLMAIELQDECELKI